MLKWLNQLSAEDKERFGTKSLILSNLIKRAPREFQIPSGFTISKALMEKFFSTNGISEEIDYILSSTDFSNPQSIISASKEIQALIMNSNFEYEFSNKILEFYEKIRLHEDLRSSTVSKDLFANSEADIVAVRASTDYLNLCDSFIGVKGAQNLLNAVKRVYSSYYSPENIFYRSTKNISQNFCGVIVQRAVRAEKSGNAFLHTKNILIDGVFGLGNILAEGEICPDFYTLDIESGNIEGRIAAKEFGEFFNELGDVERIRIDPSRRKEQVFSNEEISQIFKALSYINNITDMNSISFSIAKSRLYILNAFNENFENCFSIKEPAYSSGLGFGNARGLAKYVENDQIGQVEILLSKKALKKFLIFRAKAFAFDNGSISSKIFRALKSLEIPAIVATENATSLNNEHVEIFGNSILKIQEIASPISEDLAILKTATDIISIGEGANKNFSCIILPFASEETLQRITQLHKDVWIFDDTFAQNPGFFTNYPQVGIISKNLKEQNIPLRKALLIDNYSQILSLEGTENVEKIFLKAEDLFYDLKALRNSIKRLSELFRDRAQICLLLEHINPEIVKEAVYAGVDAIAAKNEHLHYLEAIISRFEHKLIIEKLRKL
jgi:phosphoenolpyruvate synthase/pyruvate phosphate dikinase